MSLASASKAKRLSLVLLSFFIVACPSPSRPPPGIAPGVFASGEHQVDTGLCLPVWRTQIWPAMETMAQPGVRLRAGERASWRKQITMTGASLDRVRRSKGFHHRVL